MMMSHHVFPFGIEVDIVVTCCIIHKWVIDDRLDELIIPESNWVPNYNYATTSSGQASEHAFMVNLRQEIASQMWVDRQNHYGN